MSKLFKSAILSLTNDNPGQFIEKSVANELAPTPDQIHIVNLLGKVVRAYRNAAKELLAGKYSNLREHAPDYLIDPGNIIVACCEDGAVIRYERKSDASKIYSGWLTEGLHQAAALLSQNLIQCRESHQSISNDKDVGIVYKTSIVGEDGSTRRELSSFKICFEAITDRPEHIPEPPQKPLCVASVQNTCEFQLHGEIVPAADETSEGQSFLTRTKFRLPVGWECIEIYPCLNLDAWKVEYAPVWAENDILASVTAKQLHESHYQSLDQKSGARKHYSSILNDFKNLLESNPEREEELQVFLRDRPYLLCPTHIKMWPKLAIGENVTDFVFKEANSNYLLVEIEKSTHSLFRRDGHARNEVTHAVGQITDWKRYLAANLRTVQNELGLDGISANPMGLVVIGRSDALTSKNRSKLSAMNDGYSNLKIETYDEVYKNAKAVIENLFGSLDVISNSETQIYYLD